MTRGRKRVHFDASKPGHRITLALCGYTVVDVESDLTKVTCKSCLSLVAGGRKARAARARPRPAEDVQRELEEALRASLAPTADPAPRMTLQLWGSSCKGGEHRRCGECEICAWEREAQKWAAVAPWNKQHRVERPESAPRWSSLASALSALVAFERDERAQPSACGGIIDRLRRGAMGGEENSGRVDDPLMRRAGELVRVRQALELAYPEGAHALPAVKCRALLLVRTPGVVDEMPSYEMLAALFEVPVGELQALLRTGRRVVVEELAARGLIPWPRPSARQPPPQASFARYADAAAE